MKCLRQNGVNYEKHIKHMTLTIDENGNVSIELKRG